ncbi:hypothetical protein VNO77_33227 [Canavalia gladiata]|uniref:Uncharacterized protein n=1 Tax=Canavalia gladiata TaxID=3824 RepID=A0AAN9KBZ8_CANGL
MRHFLFPSNSFYVVIFTYLDLVCGNSIFWLVGPDRELAYKIRIRFWDGVEKCVFPFTLFIFPSLTSRTLTGECYGAG